MQKQNMFCTTVLQITILFAKGARQDRIKINKISATTNIKYNKIKCNKQEEDLFVFGIIHHACRQRMGMIHHGGS